MTLDSTALIALSFGMIIFPTFVIIPSAFAFYKRVADFWFTAFHISSFGIAAFSLLVAAIYSDIALFNTGSAIANSLGVLIIFFTIGTLYFLYKLQQWLWELSLLEVISEAETKVS